MTLDHLRARAAEAAGATTPTLDGVVERVEENTTPAGLAIVDEAANDATLVWLKGFGSYFAEALPSCVSEQQFIMSAVTAMATSDLRKCNAQSTIAALMMCAHFGLMPDGVQAAVIPYGGVAKFIPMYQGYIDLMYRSGMVESVVFDHIRETDKWYYNTARRAPDDFSHEPDLFAEEAQPTKLSFAFAWMASGQRSQVIFMARHQALALAAEHSVSYQKAERKRRENADDFAKNPWKDMYRSPWHTDFDAMWLKSVVRRLARRVPTSPEVRQLLKADVADSTRAERVVTPAELLKITPRVDSEGRPAITTGTSPATGAHRYIYNERTDPFCAALDGECGRYEDDEIHLID